MTDSERVAYELRYQKILRKFRYKRKCSPPTYEYRQADGSWCDKDYLPVVAEVKQGQRPHWSRR